MRIQTTVVQVGGLHWATSEAIVRKVLSRRPGVLSVEASAVSQTANITYDADRTSVAQLVGWVNECGYHCEGDRSPTTCAIRWMSPRTPTGVDPAPPAASTQPIPTRMPVTVRP